MKKADNKKLLYIVSISLILFLAGCVDTGVDNIPTSINYNSQVKIVNLASGVGTATVTMKDASGGSISFGQISFGSDAPAEGQSYQTIPAGNKTLSISYSSGGASSLLLTTESNYKMRIFLIADTSNVKSLIKRTERYIWQTKSSATDKYLYPTDTAEVAFFNASPDFTVDTVDVNGKIVVFSNGDTTVFSNLAAKALGLGDAMGYAKIKAGNYTFNFISNGIKATFSATLSSQGRYTIVIYDKASSLKGKAFTDD
jgi:hypothetical protein